jgi:dolichyl-phosphate-mannose--protein O-mannosyl transferase
LAFLVLLGIVTFTVSQPVLMDTTFLCFFVLYQFLLVFFYVDKGLLWKVERFGTQAGDIHVVN